MAGTKAGAAKIKQALIEKYGEEGYREHMSRAGKKGGKAPIGAFSVVPGLPKRAIKIRESKKHGRKNMY